MIIQHIFRGLQRPKCVPELEVFDKLGEMEKIDLIIAGCKEKFMEIRCRALAMPENKPEDKEDWAMYNELLQWEMLYKTLTTAKTLLS
jgi:hypothetical protein